MKNKFKIFKKNTHFVKSPLFFVVFSFFIFIAKADAANISIEPPGKVGVNDDFQVEVILDTDMETINAVEGKVIFDSSKLSLKEVRDSNTVVSLWVKNPADGTSRGVVEFSGITPGGYNSFGHSTRVFSMIFKSISEGTAELELKDVQVLLHDGQGSPAKVNIEKTPSITVQEGFVSENQVDHYIDAEPPEKPFIEIIRDASIENGDWVAVFYAHDKKSGIDHFELAESEDRVLDYKKLSWRTANSPQKLSDQSRKSFIYLRAVDNSGNEVVEVVPPFASKKLYENVWFWCIIIFITLLLYFGGKVWRTKSSQTRLIK